MLLSSHAVLQFLLKKKEDTFRHSSRFLPAQSPIIMRAQGSHTKPGKDYDDSFADWPPLCLCPHSSEMKGGGKLPLVV